jgi:hypothetical protein
VQPLAQPAAQRSAQRPRSSGPTALPSTRPPAPTERRILSCFFFPPFWGHDVGGVVSA